MDLSLDQAADGIFKVLSAHNYTCYLLILKPTTHSDPSEAHPLTQEEKDELDEADDEDHMHVPAVIVTAPSTPKVSALVMMLVSA